MNPMSSRMAAWLESAWLARYLERGLDPAENDWFEAYLLDKPALLAAVDADNTLRAALASERSTFERGGKDAAAAGAVASARAPQRQWPRWAALAATLVAGVGIGQFALRPHMPASAEGAKKDQAILGMTIIEGVKKNADEPYWDGGTILDPNNGKTYKVRLTPKDDGKVLEVRGFIGPFYRNQTWLRVQ